MRDVVDAVVGRAAARVGQRRGRAPGRRWRHRPDDLSPFSRGERPGAAGAARLAARRRPASTDGLAITERKPDWLRAHVHHGPEVLRLKRTVRDLELVTVCEEAGCPNLSECWADGTATFMVLGERCTRACGFCLVDTRHPEAPDAGEPERVAEAVARMGLAHAVITMVARDDLRRRRRRPIVAETVAAIRRRCAGSRRRGPGLATCKGDPAAIDAVVAARPDVFNHNLETVARLQRAVRPSAGYARSLAAARPGPRRPGS